MMVALCGDFVDALAEDGRVGQVVAGDKYVLLVLGVGFRHVAGFDEEFADEHDGQYDAHHTQRISYGAAQGRPVGIDAHLLQGLLRGTERRGVGRGAAQDTRHVGHRNVQDETHGYGQGGAEQHHGNGR